MRIPTPSPHCDVRSLAPVVALAALLLAAATLQAAAPDGRIAPLLDGMGNHQHPISTDEVHARFETASQYADVELPSARF